MTCERSSGFVRERGVRAHRPRLRARRPGPLDGGGRPPPRGPFRRQQRGKHRAARAGHRQREPHARVPLRAVTGPARRHAALQHRGGSRPLQLRRLRIRQGPRPARCLALSVRRGRRRRVLSRHCTRSHRTTSTSTRAPHGAARTSARSAPTPPPSRFRSTTACSTSTTRSRSRSSPGCSATSRPPTSARIASSISCTSSLPATSRPTARTTSRCCERSGFLRERQVRFPSRRSRYPAGFLRATDVRIRRPALGVAVHALRRPAVRAPVAAVNATRTGSHFGDMPTVADLRQVEQSQHVARLGRPAAAGGRRPPG